MDKLQLREICRQTAKRTILRQYRYQVLDRERLSEAEVRNVMAKILEESKVYYGIEVATEEKQRKKESVIHRRALVDLAIYENKKAEHPAVLIEFKRAQPTKDKIEKDFSKMMGEPANVKGTCFFHILPKEENRPGKSLERARNEVVKKYHAAYSAIKIKKCIPKWFVLFILDSSSRKLYICEKENICCIDKFDNGKWEPIKYSRGRS